MQGQHQPMRPVFVSVQSRQREVFFASEYIQVSIGVQNSQNECVQLRPGVAAAGASRGAAMLIVKVCMIKERREEKKVEKYPEGRGDNES
jgi:hypothetical protein